MIRGKNMYSRIFIYSVLLISNLNNLQAGDRFEDVKASYEHGMARAAMHSDQMDRSVVRPHLKDIFSKSFEKNKNAFLCVHSSDSSFCALFR